MECWWIWNRMEVNESNIKLVQKKLYKYNYICANH
jgi:hypothetical protein